VSATAEIGAPSIDEAPDSADIPTTPIDPVGGRRWSHRRVFVRLLAVATFFLPVAVSPVVHATSWTPKVAVALVLLVPGFVALVVRMSRRDRIAWWGGAYLAWSLVTVLLAASPVLSLVGPYQIGNGWLFFCLVVGMWAIGRELTTAEVPQIATALRWAVVANGSAAWLATYSGFRVPALIETFSGRSYGMVGNPVQLGGLMAAAVVLIGDRAIACRWWLLGMVLAGGAVQLSGSRQGILLLVAGLAYLIWRYRKGAVLVVLACVAGIALATPLVSGGGTARLTTTAQSGDAERLDTWRVGLASTIDHPLFGSGPGLFEDATEPYRRPGWSGCVTGRFLDAHNLFVQQAVATGLIGLALFGVFVLGVLRRARSALGVFGVLLAATTLLQPSFVGMTPVAFLAMGASAVGATSGSWRRSARAVAIVGAVIGLLAGAAFVRADMKYKVADALDTNAAAALIQADRWMPPWWEVARQGVRTTVIDDESTALAWAQEAARRDPQSAQAMLQLGAMERRYGSQDVAWSALERSLQLDPSLRDSAIQLRGLAAEAGRSVPAAAEHLIAATESCPLNVFQAASS
jgi:O-antigen ligase